MQETRATIADTHADFIERVEEKFKALEEKVLSEFNHIKQKLHEFFHPGETAPGLQRKPDAPASEPEAPALTSFVPQDSNAAPAVDEKDHIET